MVADRIADFITRIKNASDVDKSSVSVPYTKMVAQVAELLKQEGYVADTDTKGKGVQKSLVVTLAYKENGQPKVTGVKRVSKLSRRMYLSASDIKPVRSGYGMVVLSTPAGIVTGTTAQQNNVGGEVLFQIW